MDNGCCYCFVESTGERTFVCHHGAEYRFQKEWFRLVPLDEIDTVYICGLEIEETTGSVIVSFLEEHPYLAVFFAPGPRLTVIDPALTERLFRLHPILHLNETEALAVSGASSVSEAASRLYEKPETPSSSPLVKKAAATLTGSRPGRSRQCTPSRPIPSEPGIPISAPSLPA